MASPKHIPQATTGLADCDDRIGACAVLPDISWHVRTRCQLDGYQNKFQTQGRGNKLKKTSTGTNFPKFGVLFKRCVGWARNPLHQSTFQKVLSAEASHNTLHLQHNSVSRNQFNPEYSGAVSNRTQQAVVSRVQNWDCWLLSQIAQNSVSTPEA